MTTVSYTDNLKLLSLIIWFIGLAYSEKTFQWSATYPLTWSLISRFFILNISEKFEGPIIKRWVPKRHETVSTAQNILNEDLFLYLKRKIILTFLYFVIFGDNSLLLENLPIIKWSPETEVPYKAENDFVLQYIGSTKFEAKVYLIQELARMEGQLIKKIFA